MKIDLSKANLSRDLHELFMSAILPRPIAWVSTIIKNGVYNLAPSAPLPPLV
jgi:hypothetical protein